MILDESADAIVTTGRKLSGANRRLAAETAQRLGLPLVPRAGESIEALAARYGSEFVLVAKKNSLVLKTSGGELFFHPNMAHLRIKALKGGGRDHLVAAMGLEPGMTVLDCTMGPAADAMVASYVAGEAGKVTALEASPLIWAVVAHGLAHYLADNYELHSAMRRIVALNARYQDYLAAQADKSFDVVYFDPMFRHPLQDSENLSPLRPVADHAPVSAAAVAAALRVARRRVVLKENSRSGEFARLGFTDTVGGHYSHVKYGVMNVL